jgi:hypothetical protein
MHNGKTSVSPKEDVVTILASCNSLYCGAEEDVTRPYFLAKSRRQMTPASAHRDPRYD